MCFEISRAWVRNLISPFIGCVTLEKELNLSEPSLKYQVTSSTLTGVLWCLLREGTK